MIAKEKIRQIEHPNMSLDIPTPLTITQFAATLVPVRVDLLCVYTRLFQVV